MLVTGHSLCASVEFDVSRSTAVGVALLASFIVTGGATAAMGREGSMRRSEGSFSALRDSCAQIVGAGLVAVGAALALGFAAQALAPVMRWDGFLLSAAYFVALSTLWLGLGALHVVRLHGFMFASTTAGALGVAALVRLGGASVHLAQLGMIPLVAGLAFLRADRRLRELERSAGAHATTRQRPEVSAGLLLTYAAFGVGYAMLLTADRLLAWSAPSRFAPQAVWFHSAYELGMDWALLSLLAPVAYLECAVHGFYVHVERSQQALTLGERSAHRVGLAAFAGRALRRLGVVSALSVALAWLAVRLLVPAAGTETLRDFLKDPATERVFWAAALGYQALAVGLGGGLLLFSLNRPAAVVKGVWRALAVALAVGFVASRALAPEAAVLGFLAGATVFAHATWRAARSCVEDGDYHYYAAY